MRTLAHAQNRPRDRASSTLARSNTPTSVSVHNIHPLLHLQRTLGNQQVQRLLRANTKERDAGTGVTEPHGFGHKLTQLSTNTAIQRMDACPPTLQGPTPSGWQSYHGDPSVFHCGFRGILEDRRPTSDDPQNECFYDHSGVLVDESHPFSGCRGTPNQYDSDEHPILHALIDSGGIVRAGVPAFVESRVHEAAGWLGGLEWEIKKLYGIP